MAGKKKMAILMILGIIAIAVACVAAYFFIFTKVNPPLKNNQVKIGNAVFTVEVASTIAEKARGLSFRAGLGADQGMLFLFGQPTIQNFWMKDMNFPIDMVWIGGGKVLGFAENAMPQPGAMWWSLKVYTSPDGTDQVLEMNAGTVAKDNIKIGDAVQIGQFN